RTVHGPTPRRSIMAICGVQQVETRCVRWWPPIRPEIVRSHHEAVPPAQVKGLGAVTSDGVEASAAQARRLSGRSPRAGAQPRWKTARPTVSFTARILSAVAPGGAELLPQPVKSTEAATAMPAAATRMPGLYAAAMRIRHPMWASV